jgi:hypothetical protein
MKDESKEIRKDLIAILENIGIRSKSRGEELDIEALIDLSNGISEYLSSRKQSVSL